MRASRVELSKRCQGRIPLMQGQPESISTDSPLMLLVWNLEAIHLSWPQQKEALLGIVCRSLAKQQKHARDIAQCLLSGLPRHLLEAEVF